ncbi:MAG TPA: amidohydrolase family protein [Acidimicrobiales bacterium]|nr:amidohydrolase family protein [Acidimicrobiales bacterium]
MAIGRPTLISADSHVNEAPDLWEARLTEQLRDRGPRLVHTDDGRDLWVAEGINPVPLMWATNAAGQRGDGEAFDDHEMTITRDEMMRGSYDPVARLADMDADGLSAEVLYPGPLGGLGGGGGVAALPDPELRWACLRAYNDWLAEFCAVAPERLVGLALVRIEEPDLAAAELERAAGLGLRGAVINAMPDTTGAEPIFSPTYEPVWSAAEDAGIPLSLHIGHCRSLAPIASAASRTAEAGTGNPLSAAGSQTGLAEMFFTMMCLDMAEPVSLLVFSGVLERHPRLRFVIAESGIGWIPFVLERMDYTFGRHRNWMKTGISERPSDQFRRSFHATFQQDDETGLLARHITGVDTLLWASDYPHTDSTWPYSQRVVERLFEGVPDDERELICAGNARRLYGLAEPAA